MSECKEELIEGDQNQIEVRGGGTYWSQADNEVLIPNDEYPPQL